MQGWHGWDEYAPFYDWENARTVGRRDVAFWKGLAGRAGGGVLELGCGTGRLSVPVAREVERFVGIDRSAPMLDRLRARLRRARLGRRAQLVRGDIRALPFRKRFRVDLVMAPYGMLQSLLRDTDLRATMDSAAGVLRRGGMFGIDLVPDLPRWQEYERRTSLRGESPGGGRLTLIETVRQDRDRHLTIFDQEFVERRRGKRAIHRFSLAFRTLSVRQVTSRLERAGFSVDAVLGDYQGEPWSPEADVWVIVARRR
jgi:SAM-dependent methyltransferase